MSTQAIYFLHWCGGFRNCSRFSSIDQVLNVGCLSFKLCRVALVSFLDLYFQIGAWYVHQWDTKSLCSWLWFLGFSDCSLVSFQQVPWLIQLFLRFSLFWTVALVMLWFQSLFNISSWVFGGLWQEPKQSFSASILESLNTDYLKPKATQDSIAPVQGHFTMWILRL